MSETTVFFATRSDFLSGLTSIVRDRRVYCICAKTYNIRFPEIYESLSNIPDIGISIHGMYVRNPRYWIRNSRWWWRAKMRKIRYRDKRHLPWQTRYELAFDSMPDGIDLSCGGTFGNQCIIPSSISYATHNITAIELYKWCRDRLLEGFVKEQGVYIGPEANRLRRRGVALTYAAGGEQAVS